MILKPVLFNPKEKSDFDLCFAKEMGKNINKFGLPALIVVMMLLTGCRSHKKAAVKVPGEETVRVEISGTKTEKQLAEAALAWVGTPYKYGASEKGEATDCSGMVMVIYEEVMDIRMPRNSAKQAEFCFPLEREEVLPGDLVFFAIGSDPEKVSHVGMMIGGEKFVHASSSKGVIISEMTTPYYQRHFIMYGRVPGK